MFFPISSEIVLQVQHTPTGTVDEITLGLFLEKGVPVLSVCKAVLFKGRRDALCEDLVFTVFVSFLEQIGVVYGEAFEQRAFDTAKFSPNISVNLPRKSSGTHVEYPDGGVARHEETNKCGLEWSMKLTSADHVPGEDVGVPRPQGLMSIGNVFKDIVVFFTEVGARAGLVKKTYPLATWLLKVAESEGAWELLRNALLRSGPPDACSEATRFWGYLFGLRKFGRKLWGLILPDVQPEWCSAASQPPSPVAATRFLRRFGGGRVFRRTLEAWLIQQQG